MEEKMSSEFKNKKNKVIVIILVFIAILVLFFWMGRVSKTSTELSKSQEFLAERQEGIQKELRDLNKKIGDDLILMQDYIQRQEEAAFENNSRILELSYKINNISSINNQATISYQLTPKNMTDNSTIFLLRDNINVEMERRSFYYEGELNQYIWEPIIPFIALDDGETTEVERTQHQHRHNSVAELILPKISFDSQKINSMASDEKFYERKGELNIITKPSEVKMYDGNTGDYVGFSEIQFVALHNNKEVKRETMDLSLEQKGFIPYEVDVEIPIDETDSVALLLEAKDQLGYQHTIYISSLNIDKDPSIIEVTNRGDMVFSYER